MAHTKQPSVSLLILLFILALNTALLLPSAVSAQETPTTQEEITADEVNDVARELWCPLCSGVRLDACELKACDQMKDEIAIKLADGANLTDIKQYFVNQYGPQVLGEPPREGFNLLAWLLPIAVMLLAGLFVVTRGRGMMRREEPAPQTIQTALPAGSQTDPYTQRLEEELKNYD